MAQQFNLTAQINLQSPKNVGRVVSDIQRQLKGSGLNTVNIKVKADPRSMAQTNKQLQNVSKNSRAAAKDISTLNRNLQEATRRFSVITIATGTLLSLVTGFKNATKAAVEFERELIKISQVTGKSVQQLQGLTKEVTRLSTSFGVSSADLLNVSRTLAQAGFAADQTRKALDILAKTTLAATFDNIQDTTEGAIALLRQFGNEAKAAGGDIKFLEKSLDAINAVSKSFAVESGDLITVIRRVGGVFSSAGGSINELIALFTSVRSTTRESAETIATGLRTIFTRIQRTETIEQLKSLNIQLQDSQGRFVGAFEAVRRLSQGLSALDPRDFRFSQIVEELGGFRQIGKVIPLIQQFAVAQDALNVAQGASGSTAADAAKAQLGLGVQIQKVREEFAALIRKFTDSGPFNSIATGALKIASAMIKVAEAVEPLLPLLTTMFGLKLGRSLAPGLASLAGVAGSGRGGGGAGFSKFARGGVVPGSGNRDTVPAMLTPGEFVIKKSSVKSLGASTLQTMNENRFNLGKQIKANLGDKTAARTGQTYTRENLGNIQVLDDLGAAALGAEVEKYAGAFLRPEGANRVSKGTIDAKVMQNAFKRSPKIVAAKKRTGASKLIDNELKEIGAAASSGGRYGFALHAGSLSKDKSDKLEATILGGVGKAIKTGANEVHGNLGRSSKLDAGTLAGIMTSANVDNVVGNIFEGVITALGTKNPYDDRDSNADFDYASGLQGERARIFGLSSVADVPTDAKSTFNGANLKSFLKKVKNYETAKSVEDVLKAVTPALDAMKAQRSQPTAEQQARTQKNQAKLAKKRERANYAKGGSVSDTVPALLTPGEFVFNKGAAKSIGYGNLNRMNKQGVQGFAKGGPVGVQAFNEGGMATQVSTGGSAADLIKQAEDAAEAIEKNTNQQKKNTTGLGKFASGIDKGKKKLDNLANKFAGAAGSAQKIAGTAQNFVFLGASIGAVTGQMSSLDDATKQAINETAGFAAGVVGIGATVVETLASVVTSAAAQKVSSDAVTQANLQQAGSQKIPDGGGDALKGAGRGASILGGFIAGLAVAVGTLKFFSARNKAVAEGLKKQIDDAFSGIKEGAQADADAIKTAAREEIEARNRSSAQFSTGALATAGSFALAGAAIGSIVPGVGNAVGALVGGLVGGALGAAAALGLVETGLFGEIEARQKEIAEIEKTIDSIIALNQAQRDLEQGIANIDAAKGLSQAEVVNQRLAVQSGGPDTFGDFAESQAALNKLAESVGKTADQLTEADFEDNAAGLSRFNLATKQAESALSLAESRFKVTSQTFSLAMDAADPSKTFEELSTQSGPYKEALDAQIKSIRDRTNIESLQAQQALSNAKTDKERQRASENLRKIEERGAQAEKNTIDGAKAVQNAKFAEAEEARKSAQAQIALRQQIIKTNKFFANLSRQSDALDAQALAIDNFTATLTGAAFKIEDISVDELGDITNVKDIDKFAKQLAAATKGAGPEAQKFSKQVLETAKVFQKANEELLGMRFDSEGINAKEILESVGLTPELLGGGQEGKDLFAKISSEFAKAASDGVIDSDELDSILALAAESSETAAKAIEGLAQNANKRLDVLRSSLAAEETLRQEEIKAREAQIDAIRKGVSRFEKAQETLAKSIDPNADFKRTRGVETRLQNISAQGRLDSLGIGLQAGDVGGVGATRRDAQTRLARLSQVDQTDPNFDREAFAKETARLQTIVKVTGDELKRLADRSSEAADIQGAMEDNLRAIEKERAARQQVTGVIEDFVIGGQEARQGLVQAAAGVRQAFATGTLQGQTPEQRQATVGLLDRLSDVQVAGGLTGKEIKQELVFRDAIRLGLDPKIADAIANGTTTEEKLIDANKQLADQMRLLTVATLAAAQEIDVNPANMASGGLVQYRAGGGSIFKPRGTDTVPAMLSPGEFVIRKSAVDSIGTGTLAAINEGGVAYRNTGSKKPEGKLSWWEKALGFYERKPGEEESESSKAFKKLGSGLDLANVPKRLGVPEGGMFDGKLIAEGLKPYGSGPSGQELMNQRAGFQAGRDAGAKTAAMKKTERDMQTTTAPKPQTMASISYGGPMFLGQHRGAPTEFSFAGSNIDDSGPTDGPMILGLGRQLGNSGARALSSATSPMRQNITNAGQYDYLTKPGVDAPQDRLDKNKKGAAERQRAEVDRKSEFAQRRFSSRNTERPATHDPITGNALTNVNADHLFELGPVAGLGLPSGGEMGQALKDQDAARAIGSDLMNVPDYLGGEGKGGLSWRFATPQGLGREIFAAGGAGDAVTQFMFGAPPPDRPETETERLLRENRESVDSGVNAKKREKEREEEKSFYDRQQEDRNFARITAQKDFKREMAEKRAKMAELDAQIEAGGSPEFLEKQAKRERDYGFRRDLERDEEERFEAQMTRLKEEGASLDSQFDANINKPITATYTDRQLEVLDQNPLERFPGAQDKFRGGSSSRPDASDAIMKGLKFDEEGVLGGSVSRDKEGYSSVIGATGRLNKEERLATARQKRAESGEEPTPRQKARDRRNSRRGISGREERKERLRAQREQIQASVAQQREQRAGQGVQQTGGRDRGEVDITANKYQRILRTQGPNAAKKYASMMGYEPPKARGITQRRRPQQQQQGFGNTDINQLIQQLLRQLLGGQGGGGGGVRPKNLATGGLVASYFKNGGLSNIDKARVATGKLQSNRTGGMTDFFVDMFGGGQKEGSFAQNLEGSMSAREKAIRQEENKTNIFQTARRTIFEDSGAQQVPIGGTVVSAANAMIDTGYQLTTGEYDAGSLASQIPQLGASFIPGLKFSKKNRIVKEVLEDLAKNPFENAVGLAGGGGVAGTDFIPAMLTPGEFIMSAGAVRQHGVGTMKALNRGKVPGFNRGGMVGGVQYRQDGGFMGMMGSAAQSLGIDTSEITKTFDNFVGNFSGTLDSITTAFSPIAAAISGLAETFSNINITSTLTVDGQLNISGVDSSAIAEELKQAFGTMIGDEVKRILENNNKEARPQ